MRTLASIQLIAEVQPIEGADSIEKVRVNDWWCVAKKGEFTVDAPCVYFEIDSLLPSSNPAFEFLAKGTKEKKMNIDGVEYVGYRLKTIRLRGQISQGLALPLEILQDKIYSTTGDPCSYLKVGDDISKTLGIVKYEPPIPAELAGKMKGNFPSFIPMTDEERVQNLGDIVEANKGNIFYVTEKLDGTSFTAYIKDGVFGVCSRNIDLLESEGNTHWKIARIYGLEEKLRADGRNLAIQGEVVGEGIQANPLRLLGWGLFVFGVYDISLGKYLDFADFISFCSANDLQTVPILHDALTLDNTVTGLLEMAEGKSVLNDETEREGIVFRPLAETTYTVRGETRRLSFKAISNAYLLDERD